MTELQRSAINKETLDLVDAEVGQVQAALAQLGKLGEDLFASEETLAWLAAETTKLRSNADSLSKDKRMPSFAIPSP